MTPKSVAASAADEAPYSLGYWTQQPNQSGMEVHDVCGLTEVEFDGYLAAIATYRALTERTTYQLLLRHRYALATTLDAYANVERIGGSFRRLSPTVMGVALIDELICWLAVGRLYLVSSEDFMRVRFGDPSDQLERFRTTTHQAFDTYPGYRFMYNLRDYAQHCGVPASGVTVGRGDAQLRVLDLYLHRSDLLVAHFEWSSHAKKLLEDFPEQIAVTPLLIDAMSGYSAIEDEVLRILVEACASALPQMREAVQRIGLAAGEQHAAVFRYEDRDDGVAGVNLSFQSFPPPSALDALDAAAASPDPLKQLRRSWTPPSRTPALKHADQQAAAVMGVWLEHGGDSSQLQEAMNSVLAAGNGDPTVLVSGLVNLCAYSMGMVAELVGSTTQSLIGGFVDYAASSPKLRRT